MQEKEIDYRKRDVSAASTLLDAMKQMDALDKKLLVVVEEHQFIGLLSVGDIQRSVIKNVALDTSIDKILRKNIRVGKTDDSFETIRRMMLKFRMEFCPVVDDKNKIVNIYFWEDVFDDQPTQPVDSFQLPVVIMAGGMGTRLRPLTNVLPKPLVPIGEKTMLEEIFDRFGRHGCDHYFISVNYKADLIEFYLKGQNLPYKLEFFREEKPRGTAGSLSLLKGKLNQTFFVNNCDILIDQDYSEILKYHREHKNEITLVAALKNYAIPYGTLETGDAGELLEIREKPEMVFKINSGMYILEPHLLDEIPENDFFHITDLINKIKQRKGQVGVFPVSEKSWKDVGDWKEYISNLI